MLEMDMFHLMYGTSPFSTGSPFARLLSILGSPAGEQTWSKPLAEGQCYWSTPP
ncbi:hypothetical protein BJX61DRAFT_527176 [Aspergillus egyptiacus]|nr:hypothetical protein BJX61DRAFT_527176 [Aspergillus egyptiacus]